MIQISEETMATYSSLKFDPPPHTDIMSGERCTKLSADESTQSQIQFLK